MGSPAELLKYVDTTKKGIEIAPYFNPTLAKRDGYDILTLDVFDTERLRDNARNDVMVPNDRLHEIEEVDLVGDASGIGDVVREAGLEGQLGYIISSHNFEHLPNPILFLQGCYDALAPGGMLSMVVPDYRACFDHFRMPTRLSDWLGAYYDGRRQPSPETLFDYLFNQARAHADGHMVDAVDIATARIGEVRPSTDPHDVFAKYVADRTDPGPYRDAHCTTFFPELFELMYRDLRQLGLIRFDIEEITETSVFEFYIHLRKPEEFKPIPDAEYAARRWELLQVVSTSLGAAGFAEKPLMQELKDRFRRRFGRN